jgi:gliding motility associated protien GldN
MKKFISVVLFALLFLVVPGTLDAQSVINPNAPRDGPYVREHINHRKPIDYTFLREADVMWAKRIWRVIDVREKLNLPIYNYENEPKKNRFSLFYIIKKGLEEGALHAYDNPVFDDEFQYEMPLSQVKAKLNRMDTSYSQNPNTGDIDTILVPRAIESQQVVRYWVKEDWFFDKQRSVMDVRIIGICPLIEKKDENTGEFRSYEALFWLYFPECRPYFAQYEVFNRFNDAERRTFDDIFHKRLFSSFIFKESNVYNRQVYQYAQNIDALLEADRIKDDLFIIEHDLWHF